MSEEGLFSRVVIAERRFRVAYIIILMLILVVSALVGYCPARVGCARPSLSI
jgi:hypothetical protein